MHVTEASARLRAFMVRSVGIALASVVAACGATNDSDAGNAADTVTVDRGPGTDVVDTVTVDDTANPSDVPIATQDVPVVDVVSTPDAATAPDSSVDATSAVDVHDVADVPVAIDAHDVVDVTPTMDVVDVAVGMDAAAEASTGCVPTATVLSDGHHNPGMVCTLCHATGGPAPAWSVSGTLYGDVAGTAPVAGATVHVVDATGAVIDLVTSTNGNFYTALAVAYPARVSVSRCPSAMPMSIPVPSSAGCNSCHGTGARIHLP